ncbi:MAG: hypothetical protein WC866_04255 [Patescibacteria group bacterium]
MINHRNACFVLYRSDEDGTLRVYLTNTKDPEKLRGEMVELGQPISTHAPVFKDSTAHEVALAFDRTCHHGRATEGYEFTLLETIFLLGAEAGRTLGRRETLEERARVAAQSIVLPSPEDAATD